MQSLKEFCKQLVLWTPVAVHLTTEYARLDRVTGSSMQPTLNPDPQAGNDVVLVDLLSRAYHWYQPGDIVVVSSPRDPSKQLLKRLIALQGSTIRVPEQGGALKIPQGKCWIEGDNPAVSEDSASEYGPVPMALIRGRVMAVVWPPSRVQLIQRSGRITERQAA
mmetsp:Transcript_12778/g.35905  ORF Transcript_12778/g.35905 Transcript_12778/m.35905 type:complete len:164 (-) Transcript_12778:331-822(-)|eukprot:CAMPEP_0117651648 /NCGR_PEP_ID=MMETSP0804-20121206/2207_1 /TAXON_ID=1074897 /ORGANISM="Tetraselmis astigmatica, Strain CCMP880" /LENGTH=163 /DNA_ID=CAMNT_0005457645 /DNA_START=407 /DNA_END=898 /DNA_ORIENTATION=-